MKISTLILSFSLLIIGFKAQAQVGIGTNSPNASAQLEVSSTTKGFLPPRMTEAQKIAITNPVNGLVVYQTDAPSGLYLYNAGAWKILDVLLGVPYMGATQAVDLGLHDLTVSYLTIGAGPDPLSANTILGESALYNLTLLGYGNTAVGSAALFKTENGVSNTAIGTDALRDNISGIKNTASGEGALNKNTGSSNTGTGYAALAVNLSGSNNTAIGALADVSVNNLTNATAIGYAAKVATSNTIQLGNTSVTAVKTSGAISAGAGTSTVNGTLVVGATSATGSTAVLEASSTTQGFLPPRMTSAQKNAISNPATGLMIYCTNCGVNGEPEYYNGVTWLNLAGSAAAAGPVVIGNQQWMEKNLDVSTYRNGDIIPQVTDPSAWEGLTTGAWCYYNNDPLNGAIYGKLYNWYAVNDSRGLAPQGWHIPTDSEWSTLGTFLGGDASAGAKMYNSTEWGNYNPGATNQSGFTAVPGGDRYINGFFANAGGESRIWTATEKNSSNAFNIQLQGWTNRLNRADMDKKNGLSVRCLRD